jgi:predicted metal-binding membrane protein
MVAAMMLPASLPAVRAVAASERGSEIGSAVAPSVRFLAVFAIGWTLFGLAAFAGDAVVHRTVDATPWLAERTWLIELGVLAMAGAWQLVPLKRRGLAACRHPIATVGDGAARAGVRHVLDCLASSWALMLLMFAAGFANIAWMAILAAVMTYEATGRHGVWVATIAGVVLLGLAGVVLWTGLTGVQVLGSLV